MSGTQLPGDLYLTLVEVHLKECKLFQLHLTVVRPAHGGAAL